MKKGVIVLILFVFIISPIHAKDIELEPRVGVSTSPFNGWGLNLSGMASFGLSSLFYVQGGFLLNTVKPDSYSNVLDINIPVYASFRIPVKNTKIRLNAGPYVKFNNYTALGISAEGGVEYKRFYAGLSYFQNCTQYHQILFNLSVGYKFRLK